MADRDEPQCAACDWDVAPLPGAPGLYYKKSWAALFLQNWSPSVSAAGLKWQPSSEAVAGQVSHGDPVAIYGSGPDIESARSMEESECAACAHARKQKRRVLPYGPVPEARLHEEPFASAPAIYDYNVPKYHAMHLRAREFAKTHQRRLSWTIARDVPLYHEDRTLPADQLREKLCRWLMIHDQRTAHITSILPLVEGLPVRLTESIDRARQLYRNRRGTIVGWAPHPEVTREEADNEWLLSHMP